MKETVTSKAHGVVLETMCGFTSYVDDSPHIQEVLAMDFCKEALELYDRPERTRVLFDLDTIGEEREIDFLPNESVDTVCVTFGVNYLTDPLAVYGEFQRILTPGGKVIIVGGTSCGYGDLVKQPFNPTIHGRLLEKADFGVDVETLPYKGLFAGPTYYLLEATKAN